MRKQEKALSEKIFLKNPINGEPMRILNVEGAEKGHDHIKILCQGLTGAFVHKIYSEEV
jgi:hypothetical protein